MSVDWQRIDDNRLMLWVMHAFASRFKHHAILKGGMQLMLMNSERKTNDLDYVFVPYKSKNDIAPQIEEVLAEIPNAAIEREMHSDTGRYRIKVGLADVQVQFNVAPAMPSIELTTQLLANRVDTLPKIIRVMHPDIALAHKLAAWNERRLLRDLYDAYYMHTHIGAKPDIAVLKQRLGRIESRLPKLKKIRKMTIEDFTRQLKETTAQLTEKDLQSELALTLHQDWLKGLLPVLKTKLNELALFLEHGVS